MRNLLFVLALAGCGYEEGDLDRGLECIDGCSPKVASSTPEPAPVPQTCTVVEAEDGVVLACTNGRSAPILNGKPGVDGETGAPGDTGPQGEPGDDCKVTSVPEGAEIQCGSDPAVFVPAGTVCTTVRLSNNEVYIQCGIQPAIIIKG